MHLLNPVIRADRYAEHRIIHPYGLLQHSAFSMRCVAIGQGAYIGSKISMLCSNRTKKAESKHVWTTFTVTNRVVWMKDPGLGNAS